VDEYGDAIHALRKQCSRRSKRTRTKREDQLAGDCLYALPTVCATIMPNDLKNGRRETIKGLAGAGLSINRQFQM